MKVLKWAAALIAAVMLAFTQIYAPLSAYAAQSGSDAESGVLYARASSREAYFCTSADLSAAIFAVPYTYCVEIIYEEGEWYRAKYAEDSGIYRAVYGYVLKSDFEVLDETPPALYLYKSVSVTFSQDSGGNLPAIDDITVTAAFYGPYYSGATGYSYVLCNGSFGYIMGANEDYPLIVTDDDDPPPEEQEEDEPSGSGAIVAAVVIGVIAVLAVGLVAASSRKPHRKRPEDPFGS